MKKSIFLGLFIFCFSSCKSYLINLALESKDVYDDEVILSHVSKDDKFMVFIPMHHLGTKLFYEDVKKRVDSLKREGYFFYNELVKADKKDTITIRKSIKLTGIPYSRNTNGYKHFFDSIYKGKFKFKKELMDQPKYSNFGLDSLNSEIVDVSMKEMIQFYESKYGEIKLEPCDFKKSFYEIPDCNSKSASKEVLNDVYIKFRNSRIIETFLKDNRKKIAIIYGGAHVEGVRNELLKQGFVTKQKIEIKAK